MALDNDKMLTLHEVAKQLNVSTQAVRMWVKSKYIPSFKLGTVYRFKQSEITMWLESQSFTDVK